MTKNILVLCTGNSARSIMAEAYINHVSNSTWRAYSAGSTPTGKVNPFAISTLENEGIRPPEIRSKSWDEFASDTAPQMDVVVTVCDNAANEACPVWPGAPVTYHWPFPDPAAVAGSDEDKAAAFARVFEQIREAVDSFMAGKTPLNAKREVI
jgi:arsenate reductase